MECPVCHAQMTPSKAGWLCGGCGHIEAATLDLSTSTSVPIPAVAAVEPEMSARLITVDVEQSVWEYLTATPLAIGAAVGIVAIFGVGAIFSLAIMDSILGFGVLFFWMVVLLVVGWRLLQLELAAKFLQRFAQANFFKFETETAYDGARGSLFNLPGRKRLFDMVEGSYGGQEMRFYLYDRLVGQTRSEEHHRYSVLELVLPAAVYQLVIHAKHHLPPIDYEGSLATLEPLSVEGSFNTDYEVLMTPGQQIQALVLLAPDVLAILADNLRSFDLELQGNRLFLYYNDYITSQDVLGDMFNVANLVMDKIGPMVERGA